MWPHGHRRWCERGSTGAAASSDVLHRPEWLEVRSAQVVGSPFPPATNQRVWLGWTKVVREAPNTSGRPKPEPKIGKRDHGPPPNETPTLNRPTSPVSPRGSLKAVIILLRAQDCRVRHSHTPVAENAAYQPAAQLRGGAGSPQMANGSSPY